MLKQEVQKEIVQVLRPSLKALEEAAGQISDTEVLLPSILWGDVPT